MAPRVPRTTNGQTRTHARSASGGSSKIGLNLHLTQRDASSGNLADKPKKNGHNLHEQTATRTKSPLPRSNSALRRSREHMAPALTPLHRIAQGPGAKPATGKGKADFRLSSPSENDDDGWVSSESGAATPSADSDTEQTDESPPPHKSTTQFVNARPNGIARDDLPTPRAITPALPQVDRRQPTPPPTARDYAAEQQAWHLVQQQQLAQSKAQHIQGDVRQQQPSRPEVRVDEPEPTSPARARSETHSPPRRSPDVHPKRQAVTRPPSIHRADSAPLRPHPLIRGQSYGLGPAYAAKPSPLAPLTTVTSDNASAQMSTNSSPTSAHLRSPSTFSAASGSPNAPSASPTGPHSLRRTSVSSNFSTATAPLPPSISHSQLSRSNHDRQRTLSTSSSSLAALSNLAFRSTPSPPRTPVAFSSHFPPIEQTAHLETIHPLLPPPYLSTHLSVLATRNPLAESYARVMSAKRAR
ncbi:hypothetical protein CERSUDRAFT_117675 [Gelatoporia subvermispora B]|uniref:Uncharacterized protein n=1 Tax=Ceriporiopsis subvermispora (strain B) TaxID=914234 RepID=M2QN07_CERS8|nr:hypothetical protein CERSUDRAFT_117675 [Gelatoporia subvermispora B]